MTVRLAALLVLLALPAAAQPDIWRVTGVAADDTLNVRAEPSAASADIGDLPHDARGIEVGALDASGDWGRIVWQEGNGWVAMRFLDPDPQPPIGGTELPAGLLCTGTEPFWSLRLGAGSAAYSDISGTARTLGQTDARTADGLLWPFLLTHSAGDAHAVSVVAPADCTDGMSDRLYPWRVDVLLDLGVQRRFHSGCCRFPLEAGRH